MKASAALALALLATPAIAFAQQSPSPPASATPSSASPTPAATPAPGPSNAASADLDAFAAAWAAIKSYSATVAIFDQKGTTTQNLVFDFTFHRPANITVNIVSGPNAGINLTWSGGDTIVGRKGSGLMAMFSKTIPLHDPQVTTIRGASIDQLSFGEILAHARQEAGTLSEGPGDSVNGVAVTTVTLIPTQPAADAGLTREVLQLSTATHLPVRILGYEGDTLVRKVEFSNVKLKS